MRPAQSRLCLPSMTTFLLIRHAAHDLLGKVLAGRAPDVHLNARGKMEAERLAERLESTPLRAVYAGPLERAQETAWPLAERQRLEIRTAPAFDEIDFGEWTSLTLAELGPRADWQLWNEARSRAEAPGGESMRAVQARVAQGLDRLEQAHPGEAVAIVSHGDVIKSALMHHLGIPLDFYMRLEIGPASMSVLVLDRGQPQVMAINAFGSIGPGAISGGARRV
jgi:probable phosphoglycerate mutase